MSQLFPRNNLSNIQYDTLIYYLCNDEQYKTYIKTSKKLRSLKNKNTLGPTRYINTQSEIMADAMNSLVVDSIIFKTYS